MIPEESLSTLAQTALTLFPTTPDAWSEECIGWRILTTLLESALFLPVETLDEHQRTLREMHQHVSTAPSALLALASAREDLDLPPNIPPSSAPADSSVFQFSLNVKQTQRERKAAARRRNRVQDPNTLDTDGLSGRSALEALGYALPETQEQAEEFAGRILVKCQATLKVRS